MKNHVRELYKCPKCNLAVEIASACGFADYNYFIRAFRHHTGLTPLQYRKQMRKP